MAENHGALRGLQGMMTDPPPVDMTRLPVTANATSKPTDAPDYDSIEDVATERKGLHVSPKPDQEDRAQEVEEASAEISTSGAGPSRDDKLGMSGIAGIVAGCVMCIGLAFAFVHVKRRRTPSIESDNRSDSTVGDSRYLETSNTPEQRAKAVNGASKADPRGTPSVRTRNVDGSMGVQNIHNQRLAKPLKTTRGANESPRGTGVMKSLRTESPFKDKCEVSNRTGRRTENYEFALDTRDCPILGSGDDIDESTREMAVLGGNPSQTGKK
ncbi:hypothetical protein Poli38472_000010 [Pythium oligandrum]|uniref:Uncharacterized protein n=1 Tax=Pythium oligandrum TaxID=41045 RepID=A0A8K1FIP7_PYTOL|nr:hypothetical protein Poli38472_000010 [Pythium oligandrum]|eukprot:TMW59968.1 hypothetical protein Poli38472_000010 [Pythium oligandrum]